MLDGMGFGEDPVTVNQKKASAQKKIKQKP
jgi:hypothetical protein